MINSKWRKQVIEKMAVSIHESKKNKVNSWQELLILAKQDGYMVAKNVVKHTRVQAEAALNTVIQELPKPEPYCGDDRDILLKQQEAYTRIGLQLIAMKD